MCTHEHLHFPVGEIFEGPFLLRRRTEAREHFDAHPERLEAFLECGVVLLRQDGGRAEHHHLLLVLRCLERCTQCHLGLAETHIAAHEPIHWVDRLHVGLDVRNSRKLIRCFLVRERFFHLALPGRVLSILIALCRATTRIHVHQVERKLLRSLARTPYRA